MANQNTETHSSTSSERKILMDTQLQTIIDTRSMPQFHKFLGKSTNVNELYDVDSSQINALHLTVDEGWMEALEVLIQKGVDVNLPVFVDDGDFTFTPLMRAIWHWPRPNGLAIIKFLLENGADPNYRCPRSGTYALELAVLCLNIPAVDLLLKEYKVKLAIEDRILLTACECMMVIGVPEIEDHLPKTPKGHPSRCRVATLPSGAGIVNPQPQGFLSATEGVSLVDILLENGASWETNTFYILDVLFLYLDLNTQLLDLFFAKGMNFNTIQMFRTWHSKDIETIFCNGIMYEKSKVNHVRWLIRHGAVTNIVCPENCFDLALSEKNFELFELLLHAGLMPSRSTIEKMPMATSSSGCWAYPAEPSSWNCFSEHKIAVMTEWMRFDQNQFFRLATQGNDLLQFSDETLQIFPKLDNDNGTSQGSQNTEKEEVQIKQITTLLSQPPSLKRCCRQFYRQDKWDRNTVHSVKELHLAAALKRYLLCHDV